MDNDDVGMFDIFYDVLSLGLAKDIISSDFGTNGVLHLLLLPLLCWLAASISLLRLLADLPSCHGMYGI